MRKKKIVFMILFFCFLLLIIGGIGGVVLVNRYYPLRYVDIVNEHAEMFDLDPVLILSVIHAESRFNSNAVSRVGASGLMQIMESTAYWIAPRIGLTDFNYEDQIFDPSINILLGTYYLSMLIETFGDTSTALAAYNAGRGNVRNWLNNPYFSSDGITLDYIPFPETRNYVNRVADNQRVYALLLRFPILFQR
jgi:soluble lytic murein transglycosylase